MSEEERTPEEVLRHLNVVRKMIEESRSERDQMVGKKEGLLERLRVEFNLKSLDAAHQRIRNLDEQIKRRNKTIDQQFTALSEKYDF